MCSGESGAGGRSAGAAAAAGVRAQRRRRRVGGNGGTLDRTVLAPPPPAWGRRTRALRLLGRPPWAGTGRQARAFWAWVPPWWVAHRRARSGGCGRGGRSGHEVVRGVHGAVGQHGHADADDVERRVDQVLVVTGAGHEGVEQGVDVGTHAHVLARLGPRPGRALQVGVVVQAVDRRHVVGPGLGERRERPVDPQRGSAPLLARNSLILTRNWSALVSAAAGATEEASGTIEANTAPSTMSARSDAPGPTLHSGARPPWVHEVHR